MNKKEIQNLYKKKIELINNYNKFYYDSSDPKVLDKEYDELKKEILILEKKYKFLKSKDSPSAIVGFKPSKNFVKSTHRVPMLSLANAFSKDDLVNFEKRILNFLSESDKFKIFYSPVMINWFFQSKQFIFIIIIKFNMLSDPTDP